MNHFSKKAIAGMLSLLVLAACSNNQPSADNSSPAATSDSSTPASTEADAKSTFATMKQSLERTTKAVNTDDFDLAKQEFEGFGQNWEKIEDGVREQSKELYKQIEQSMDNVDISLKDAKPDKTKANTAIQSLSTTLDNYMKTWK